jgi:hypothetical protein
MHVHHHGNVDHRSDRKTIAIVHVVERQRLPDGQITFALSELADS